MSGGPINPRTGPMEVHYQLPPLSLPPFRFAVSTYYFYSGGQYCKVGCESPRSENPPGFYHSRGPSYRRVPNQHDMSVNSLGFQYKSEDPATCIKFLRIKIDTIRLQLLVDKLLRVNGFKGYGRKKKLELLVGFLQNAPKVVKPGGPLPVSYIRRPSRVSEGYKSPRKIKCGSKCLIL